MDRQIINKRITGIQNEVEKLVRTLRAMHRCSTQRRAYNLPSATSDIQHDKHKKVRLSCFGRGGAGHRN